MKKQTNIFKLLSFLILLILLISLNCFNGGSDLFRTDKKSNSPTSMTMDEQAEAALREAFEYEGDIPADALIIKDNFEYVEEGKTYTFDISELIVKEGYTTISQGQKFTTVITMEADSDYKNIPVAISLMNKAEYESSLALVEGVDDPVSIATFSSGIYYIPAVEAGVHDYEVPVTVELKAGASYLGEFMLFPVIDPDNIVGKPLSEIAPEGETQAEYLARVKSQSRSLKTLSDEQRKFVTITDTLKDKHDLAIESVVLKSKIIVLPIIGDKSEETETKLISGSIKVSSTNKTLTNVPLSFNLKDKNTGTSYPVKLWEAATGALGSSYIISSIKANNITNISFVLDIATSVQDDIKSAMSDGRSEFVLTATLDGAGAFTADDMDTSNNAIVLDDIILLDDSKFGTSITSAKKVATRSAWIGSKGLYKSKTGGKEIDADKIKAGYKYEMLLDVRSPLANLVSASVTADGSLFGEEFSMVDAGAWAGANIGDFSEDFEGGGRTGADVHVELFGYNLYHYEQKLEFHWEKEWSKSKEFEVETRFWYVVVVSGGVFATVGLKGEIDLYYDDPAVKLQFTATPYVEAGVAATAGLDIVAASAGITGEFALLNIEVPTVASVSLDVVNLIKQEVNIGINLNSDFELSGPEGRIFAWFTYIDPTAGEACAWGVCVPLPEEVTKEHDLFTFETDIGYSKELLSLGMILNFSNPQGAEEAAAENEATKAEQEAIAQAAEEAAAEIAEQVAYRNSFGSFYHDRIYLLKNAGSGNYAGRDSNYFAVGSTEYEAKDKTWELSTDRDYYTTIVNKINTNQLYVDGASISDNAKIKLAEKSEAPHGLWYFKKKETDDTLYRIVNKLSGLCLTEDSNKTYRQMSCSDSAVNQYWKAEFYREFKKDQKFEMRSAVEYRRLGKDYINTYQGSSVFAVDQSSQAIEFEIANIYSGFLLLKVENDYLKSSGDQVVFDIRDPHRSLSPYLWYMVKQKNYYQVINKATGKCINVLDEESDFGFNKVNLSKCTGVKNQLWSF